MKSIKSINLAFFISPHGFGHAARSCAVIKAIQELDTSLIFHIYTSIPKWFIEESVIHDFEYHYLLTDIGLVQSDPFSEDLHSTVKSLNSFIPFQKCDYLDTQRYLKDVGCKLILCDISPLGIFLSETTDTKSILIENFTWDWIYKPFANISPKLKKHSEYLHHIFLQRNYHIQIEPICKIFLDANLVTGPVSRQPRTPRSKIRKQLNVASRKKMILITMGGISSRINIPDELKNNKNIIYVIPGDYPKKEVCQNIVFLPHRSNFYHPDLVNASDAVIAKVGYSTIAESYHAGVPFGYIPRPRFRESTILEDFINTEFSSVKIELSNDVLLLNQQTISKLLEDKTTYPVKENGAYAIADYVLEIINSN